MTESHDLSPAQTEIWHLQQRRPDSPSCWIAEYLDITGALDPPRFTDALRRVIDTTPALHEQFVDTKSGPRRYPHPRSSWTMTIEDVRSAPDPHAEALRRMQATLDRKQGFTPTLFDFALYRVGPARWHWFAAYHHIVIDGAGAHRIAQRLAQTYNAPAALPTPPPHQPNPTRTNDDAARDHWRTLLADWSGPIRLAGRLAVRSGEPAGRAISCQVPIPAADIARLRETATTHRRPLSTILTALIALWTHALAGARDDPADIVLGIAVRGRGASPPQMLSNVIPLRLRLDPTSTTLSLARDIARQRRAGLRHQHHRGERVLREAAPLDARSFGPTVNLMPFDYGLRFDRSTVTAHNLSIGPIDDLCVTIYDRNDGAPLRIDLDANPQLYSATHLADLAHRLARLITLAAADITIPAPAIDLLSTAERHQHLHLWNATARPIPHAGIADLFARSARADPAAPCIHHAGTTSTYATIDRDTALIARYLTQNGISTGAVVAILLPRSAAFLTILLAIARSGAAFLPLDPGNPPDRLALMIADARPALIITTSLLAAVLPAETPTMLLDDTATLQALASLLPSGPEVPAAPPPPADPDALAPDALAYAIFTSGTTGRPKAVLVSNRGIASLAAFQVAHLALTATSRVLQFASVGFDAVIMEILMAFAAGACLYLPAEPERHGPALGAFLSRHAITHALLPPVALAVLDPTTQHFPQTLVVGGEACPPEIADAWSAGRTMINAYGPTEATICTIMSDRMVPNSPPSIGPPSIGKPIWNTTAYVFDAFDRPVPAGIAGELHLAGHGLAIGYLNDPETTAARFVACPFLPGQLMFRTGDRARFRPDGSLDCLGRADRQVKLRGIRIELGEIEAALAGLPGIAQSVVIARATQDSTSLVAYLVAAAGTKIDSAILRAELATALPPAMIPSAFVRLDALPLTRHGKIDHAALPPPIAAGTEAGGAPTSTNETLIAALFAELLRLDCVGRDGNFFELGGDSLSATRLCARLREGSDADIGIGDVFAHPTVASLAARLDVIGEPQVPPLAVMLPLRNGHGRPSLFCIHTGPGLGWPYSALLRHLDQDQPVHAIQARGLDRRTPPAPDLPTLVADYATEIRRVQPHGPYRLLGWSSGGPLAHLIATHLQDHGDPVDLLVSLDGYPAGPHYSAGIPAAAGAADHSNLRAAIEAYLVEFEPSGLNRAAILDDETIAAMLDIHCNTGRLLATATSGMFRGNLLLFTCREPYHPTPMPPPTIWSPHITGALETIALDCHHDHMLNPGPATAIGQVVRQRIAALF